MESSKKLSPHHPPSPDSTLEDPSKGYPTQHTKSASTSSLPKVDQATLTVESPPTQVMDRSGNSSYRIPSAVFERNPSSTPAEWSTASNESLFSIHTGTMSFTKDHIYWRSGELGLPAEPSTSGQMFNYSGNLTPGGLANDAGKSGELGVAVETMQEVLRENAQKQSNEDNKGHNQPGEVITRQEESSHGSTKSFAFQILAGDPGKVHSATSNGTVKAAAPESEPHVQTQVQAEAPAKPETKNPKGIRRKWFPCTRCCPFSSLR